VARQVSTNGEHDLALLLQRLEPELMAGEFIFCFAATGALEDFLDLVPLAVMAEPEGLTLVLLRDIAQEAGFACDVVLRCITLTVHSSLEAVGLTAAVATALADAGISANVIAGYFHDHIFVPAERAEQALAVLKQLSADA
jgi:hypothetical protein